VLGNKGLPIGNSTVLAGIRAGGSTFIAFPDVFQASSGLVMKAA
jgi:hypothetical protein